MVLLFARVDIRKHDMVLVLPSFVRPQASSLEGLALRLQDPKLGMLFSINGTMCQGLLTFSKRLVSQAVPAHRRSEPSPIEALHL